MKAKDVEKVLQQLQTLPPPESLDQRIATVLDRGNAATGQGHANYFVMTLWQYLSRFPKTSVAASLILLVGIAVVITGMLLTSNGSIAWAEVVKSVEHDLQSNDCVHLVITDRKPIPGGEFGAFIKKEEIWVQRPFHMRSEHSWKIVENRIGISCCPNTRILNEEGDFYLVHDSKHWGFLAGDLMNIKHKVPYRQRRQQQIDRHLMARYYARYNWNDGSYDFPRGKKVEDTELNGEKVAIYEFPGREAETKKCWLRDSDDRLLRMEVYEAEYEKPVRTYVLNYDVPLHESFFVPAIPDDYTNGQILGYEDQPQLINRNVAAIVQDDNSARFHRLQLKPGQSWEEAVEVETARGRPAITIQVKQPSQLTVEVAPPGESTGQEPYRWNTIGFGCVGEVHYVVLLPEERRPPTGRWVAIMSSSEYTGQGQIILEFLYYRTDYGYCKAAFDGDGDGQMDVWCQVPSDDVVSKWLQSLRDE